MNLRKNNRSASRDLRSRDIDHQMATGSDGEQEDSSHGASDEVSADATVLHCNMANGSSSVHHLAIPRPEHFLAREGSRLATEFEDAVGTSVGARSRSAPTHTLGGNFRQFHFLSIQQGKEFACRLRLRTKTIFLLVVARTMEPPLLL
jgi:hypothetical protein